MFFYFGNLYFDNQTYADTLHTGNTKISGPWEIINLREALKSFQIPSFLFLVDNAFHALWATPWLHYLRTSIINRILALLQVDWYIKANVIEAMNIFHV